MNPYEYQFAHSEVWHCLPQNNHMRTYDYYPENMSQEVYYNTQQQSLHTSYRGFSDPMNNGQQDHFIERCSESERNPYANQCYNYTSDNCSGLPRLWLHDDSPEDIEKRNIEMRQQYRLLVDQERQLRDQERQLCDQERQLRNHRNESHPDFQIDRNLKTMQKYSRMSRNKNKHDLYRSAKQKVSPGIPVKSNRSKKDSTFSVKTRKADSTQSTNHEYLKTAGNVDVSSLKEQTVEDKSNSTLKSKTVRAGILAIKVDQNYTESDLQQENNKTVCSGNMKPNGAGNSKDSKIIGKEIVDIRNDKNKPSYAEKNVTVDSNETQISDKKVEKLKTANQESYEINNNTKANEEIVREHSCNNSSEIISKNKTLCKNNSIADVNEMINKNKQKCSKMIVEIIYKGGPKDLTTTNQTFHKPEHFDKETIISRHSSNETVITTNKVLNQTEDQAVALNNKLQNEDNKIIFKEEVQNTVKILWEAFHKMPHVAEKKMQSSVKTVNKQTLSNGKLSCPRIVTHEGLLNNTVSTKPVSQTVVEAIQGDNNAIASGKSINENHSIGDKKNNSEMALFGEAIQMECLNDVKLKTFTEEKKLMSSEKSEVLDGKYRRRRNRRRTRREIRRKKNGNKCRSNSKEAADLKLSSKAVLKEQLIDVNMKSLKEEVTLAKKSQHLNDNKIKRFNEAERELKLSEKSEHLNNGKIKGPIVTEKEVSLSEKLDYLNDDKMKDFKETNKELILLQKSEHLNDDKMKRAVETKKEVTLPEKSEYLKDDTIKSSKESKKEVTLSKKSEHFNDNKMNSTVETKKEEVTLSEKSEHLSHGEKKSYKETKKEATFSGKSEHMNDDKKKSSVETKKEGTLSEKLEHLNDNKLNDSKQAKEEATLSDKSEYLNDDKMKSSIETKKEVTLSEELEHLNDNKMKSAVQTKKEVTLSEKLEHLSDDKIKNYKESGKEVTLSEKSKYLNDNKIKCSEETKKEVTLSEKSGYLKDDKVKSSKETKKEVTLSEKSKHLIDDKLKSSKETEKEGLFSENLKHLNYEKIKNSEETKKEVTLAKKSGCLNNDKIKSSKETIKEVMSKKSEHLNDNKMKDAVETKKEVTLSEKLKYFIDGKLKSSEETIKDVTLSEKSGYLNSDKIKSSKETIKEVMSEKSEHLNDNKMKDAVETKKEVTLSEKLKHFIDGKLKSSEETIKDVTLSEKSGYLNNDKIKSSKETIKEVMSEKSEHLNDNKMKDAVETKKEVTLSEKLKHFIDGKLKSSEETIKDVTLSEKSGYLNNDKIKSSKETIKEVMSEKSEHLNDNKMKDAVETKKEVTLSEKLKHFIDGKLKSSEETIKDVTLSEKSGYLNNDKIKSSKETIKEVMLEKSEHLNDNKMKDAVETKKEVTLSEKLKHFIDGKLKSPEETIKDVTLSEKSGYLNNDKIKSSKETIKEVMSEKSEHLNDNKMKGAVETKEEVTLSENLKHFSDGKVKSSELTEKELLFSEKLEHLNDEKIKKSVDKSEQLDCDKIKSFGKTAEKEVTLSTKAVQKELLSDGKEKSLKRLIFSEKTEYISGKKIKLSEVVTIKGMPSFNKAVKKDNKIKNLVEITSPNKAIQKKHLIDEKIKSSQVATKQEVTLINSASQKENLSNDKLEVSTEAEMVLPKKEVQYVSPHCNAEIVCQNKSAKKIINSNNVTVLNKVSDSVKYCNEVANSKEEILEILNRSLCDTKINNNCVLSPNQKVRPVSRNEKVQCLGNADISPVVCEKDKIATSKQEICEILNRLVNEIRKTNNNNNNDTLFSNQIVHSMEVSKKTDTPAVRHNMTNKMINGKEFSKQITYIQNIVVNNTINFDPKSNYKDIENRIDSKQCNKVKSDNTCSVNAENVMMKCSVLNVDEKISSKGVKRNYSAEETHCIRSPSIGNETNIFKKQRQSSHANSESCSSVILPSVTSSTPRSSKKFKQEKEKFSKGHDCSEIVHRFSNYRLQKPSSVIVIRQLASHTTEEDIFKTIEENNVTPLNIKIMKCSDPCSCGLFALIVFTSMKVAQDLMESKQGRMYINMYMVTMQYASCSCESDEVDVNTTECSSYKYHVKDVPNILSSQQNNKESVNISSSVLNEDRVLSSKYQCSKEQEFEIEMGNTKEFESFFNSSTLTTDFDSSNEYPPPNGMRFTYDEAMECYHDSTTGLYYDARLKYFFNPLTEEILQYDVFKRKYVSLPEYSKSMDVWEKSRENDEELLDSDINKTILIIREWEANLKYQMIKMDLLT